MCDTLCIPTPGAMLFAKNSDRPIDEVQLVHALAPHTPDGPAATLSTQYLSIDDPGPGLPVVVSRPTWLWGAEHAVNSAGVAIGNEKVWTTDNPHEAAPALIGMDLVRLAAERAHTADAAVDLVTSLIERWGQGGSGEQHNDEPYWSSFLVVDPDGGWVVETSGRSWVAEPVAAATSVSNRLSITDGWTRSSADVPAGLDWQTRRDPLVPTGIADHRLAATTVACGQLHQFGGDHGASHHARQVVAALRDHGAGPWGAPGTPAATGSIDASPVPEGVRDDWSGITVCMHVRDYQCTTASMVAELPADPAATLRIWASLGPACCAVMLPAAIVRSGPHPEVIVPTALENPLLWQAASTMARRAEDASNSEDAGNSGDADSNVSPDSNGGAAVTLARAAFGQLESSAWDEADELTERAADASAWRQAADRWSSQAVAAATRLVAT